MSVVLLKFVHIAAIAAWSAGLLVLPFLYRQRRRLAGEALHRLQAFSRFLYVALVSPAAFVAIASGIVLIFLQATFVAWFSVKLAFVGALVIVHVMNGLMILKLFEPGKAYPAWRFALVTTLTVSLVGAILAVVLGKPDFTGIDMANGLFEPGALQTMVGGLIAWSI